MAGLDKEIISPKDAENLLKLAVNTKFGHAAVPLNGLDEVVQELVMRIFRLPPNKKDDMQIVISGDAIPNYSGEHGPKLQFQDLDAHIGLSIPIDELGSPVWKN